MPSAFEKNSSIPLGFAKLKFEAIRLPLVRLPFEIYRKTDRGIF